jgi:hypothetical protein
VGLRQFQDLAVVNASFALALALAYDVVQGACMPLGCLRPGAVCPQVCVEALNVRMESLWIGFHVGVLPGAVAAGASFVAERRGPTALRNGGAWRASLMVGVPALLAGVWFLDLLYLLPAELLGLTFGVAALLVGLLTLSLEGVRRGAAR